MKRTLIMLGLCGAIAACSGNKNTSNTEDTSSVSEESATARQSEVDTSINNVGTDNSTSSDHKGSQLIASSDCLSCHKENEKLVGPSYKEVAQKYEATDANVKYLSEKIIKGGSGVWGQVPMTPHPALSEADAKEMVNYILSLK